MKHHYLIDYENVHEEGLIGLNMIEDDAVIHIFYSDHARKLDLDSFREGQILQIEVLKVPVGKQSLDMQLVSYMGYLMGREWGQGNAFIIVSKDNGYLNSIPFWKQIMRDGTTVEVRPQIRAQDPEEIRSRSNVRRRNVPLQKNRGSRRAESDRRFDPAQEYQPEQRDPESLHWNSASESDTLHQDSVVESEQESQRRNFDSEPENLRRDSVSESENLHQDSTVPAENRQNTEIKDESSRRQERRSRSGRDRSRGRRERAQETDDQQTPESVERVGRSERSSRNARGRRSDRSRQRVHEGESVQPAVNTETAAAESFSAPLNTDQTFVRESSSVPDQAPDMEDPAVLNQTSETVEPVILSQTPDMEDPAAQDQTSETAEPVILSQTPDTEDPVAQNQASETVEPVALNQAPDSEEPAVQDQTSETVEPAVQNQASETVEPVIPDQAPDMEKQAAPIPGGKQSAEPGLIADVETTSEPAEVPVVSPSKASESVPVEKQHDKSSVPENPQKKSRRGRKPKQKQEKTIDRSALNTAIMQTLSRADIDAATTGKVASIVLKNIDDAQRKTVTYREIIRSHGQKEGLKIYNLIKALL